MSLNHITVPHTLMLAAPLPIHVQQAGASKVIGQLAANPGLAQELIEVGADMFVLIIFGGCAYCLGLLAHTFT